jgi:hypothetical protein
MVIRDRDLGAIPEPIGTVDHNVVARNETFENNDVLVVRGPELHGANGHSAVSGGEIGERTWHTHLHARSRHERDAAQCVGDELDVDELVRKEKFVLVLESRPQLYRSGRRVDLIVDGRQGTGSKQLGGISVVGLNGQRLARAQFLNELRNGVLRQRKDDGDGSHLCNDDNPPGGARLHIIARIHEAQSYPAIYRRYDAGIVQIEGRAFDCGLVGCDGGFVLLHQGTLCVDLLARDRILAH